MALADLIICCMHGDILMPSSIASCGGVAKAVPTIPLYKMQCQIHIGGIVCYYHKHKSLVDAVIAKNLF